MACVKHMGVIPLALVEIDGREYELIWNDGLTTRSGEFSGHYYIPALKTNKEGKRVAHKIKFKSKI